MKVIQNKSQCVALRTSLDGSLKGHSKFFHPTLLPKLEYDKQREEEK